MIQYRLIGNGYVLSQWEDVPARGEQYGMDGMVLAPQFLPEVVIRLDARGWQPQDATHGIRIEFRRVHLNDNEAQEALTDRAPHQRGTDDVPGPRAVPPVVE